MHLRVVAILMIAMCGSTARADLILNPLGEINWDPIAQPGGPGPIAVIVSSNASVPNANVMNAFSVGLKIVPQAGATGSITVASVSAPTIDRVFASYAAPPLLILQDSVYSVSGDNAAAANIPVPSSGLRLFEMLLTGQGANLSGKFLVVADGPKSNYFNITEFDGFKYANVGGGDFVLGSLNITSVPEPSTTLLLCSACAGIYWRNRKRKLTANRIQRRPPASVV